MKRRIVGFHQDEVGDWVADLECGHTQHVRHDPPLSDRPWVLTPEGRRRFIGFQLDCKICDGEDIRAGAPPAQSVPPPPSLPKDSGR